ncbi:RlpA-like double-psi beta-barrel-protein domain-containing protein-containing protein [Mycena pura]|uniref:RlpA-like double-psi beta-barrel-protein domain-containing protein-containing protein n=1 Tax=Mycena pura TaxID=153505 RepID=A0AAD6V9Q9_9AGAR|nr:RlpA-like double-psi beta-barrel-protein domain-containing protein-containing protein [Mycena pura]
MVSRVFAPLFFIVLGAVVNASPLASPEAIALSGLTKRQCAQTYTVVGGDTCAAIESKTGVSDAQLHQLNPSINSGCTNLQIGQSLCLSGGGSGGGGCSRTYTVVSGDTCAAIESKTGVSDASLHAQNPAINSGCTNLQIGQILCVSGGGGGGGGGTTFTAIASFYDPDGGIGACGSVLQNSDFIVALGEDTWANGAHCGETVTVSFNGASVSVIVADRCPGCNSLHGANSIDLSQGAIAALDPNFENDGIITVQWTLF